MKIEFKILNQGVVDSYIYSKEAFYHNDQEIIINDKMSQLVHLVSLTSEWDKNKMEEVGYSFYVLVETGDYYQEYYFGNRYLPNNFSLFAHEVKRLALEVK